VNVEARTTDTIIGLRAARNDVISFPCDSIPGFIE
jgi:hypothetical protein